MSMNNKVALITGAASGIGKATAIECLKKDINVSIVDVNSELGEKVLAELKASYGNDRVIFLKADVSSECEFEGAFERTIEAFGKIHIVVNNSGICEQKMWVKMINVNLVGLIYGTRLAIKYMSKESGNDGGVVINIASITGIEIYPLVPAEYCASKSGVMGYTRSCAADPVNMNKHGIRFNIVCPGLIQTPLKDKVEAELGAFFIGTAIQPLYVARAILYLIEDESRNGLIVKVEDEDTFSIVQQTVNTVEIITPK